MANVIMLGVGDHGASASKGEVVKTMALGSCVGVITLCPKTRCVGMAHVALPESSISPDRAKDRPAYFVDTGIPALLKAMEKAGASGNPRGYIVKLAGGASIMDSNNTFNIGKRNCLALRKVLWKYGMGAKSEDVGGNISRTVEVHVATGKVILSTPGKPNWEI